MQLINEVAASFH